jgi:hypothetical protein
MTRPFRATFGFDAHFQRGINLAPPQFDTDFANRLWVEEAIAAQSRLRGTYLPDSDGLQNPAPDLSALVPNVDVLTADYWVTALAGRSSTGPYALVDLNSDDRLIATNTTSGVATLTLDPGPTPHNLIPNNVYRFDPVDPAYTGVGSSLGLLVFTDGNGDINAHSVNNCGFGYQAGEVINASLENGFVNAVLTFSSVAPAAFTLSPNTTYYDAQITGGTGVGVTANFRTDGTGAAIAQFFLIDRGAGYTVNDVLTVVIEGQTIGTFTVTAVYSGTDLPITITIDTLRPLATGWSLVRGPGLTRAQADQDYLRLDGNNDPNANISWNNQRLTDLQDPSDDQDAVNLRTLATAVRATTLQVTQVGHGFATGNAVSYDLNTSSYVLADPATEAGLAVGVVVVETVDTFTLYSRGLMAWPSHGLTLGSTYYVGVGGGYLTTAPISGYIQALVQPYDANTVSILDQAVIYTGF